MGQLSDLPNELIYRIIETGCLMELHRIPYIPHPRRRLAFASLVRGVCSSWRDIIDLSTDGHFWVVVLDLTFDMDSSDTSLPRRLMEFHRHLAESWGSNLIVSFDFSVDNGLSVPAQVDGIGTSNVFFDITLRLFIHGLQMILQYQGQLFAIHVVTSQPQIDRYIYEMLCSIKDATRLAAVYLGITRQHRETGSIKGLYTPSLRDIRDLEAAIPNFQPILRNNHVKSIGSILSIDHLRNLQTLEISNLEWLKEMSLPLHISHLRVNLYLASPINLRNLAAQPTMCASLTTLSIWNDNPDGSASESEVAPEKRTSFVQEHISLPCLHSIEVIDAAVNMIDYLMHMHIPRIEHARINLWDQHPPTARLGIPQAPSPPSTFLSHLYLHCHESWIALSVLSYFTSPSLRYLTLRFRDNKVSDLGPDYDQLFEDRLGRIQPKSLEISSGDRERIFFILERLSRSNLRDLNLSWELEEYWPPLTFTGSENSEMPRSIMSSSLVKLSLVRMPLHLIIGILSSLGSHALEDLTIELPQDDESPTSTTSTRISNYNDQHPTSEVKAYASVSKFSFSQLPLSITSAHLHQFLDLIPNVEHVTLSIGSNWATAGDSIFITGPSIHKTSFRKFWIPICEALQPDTVSGLCPLLCLTNLAISFPLGSKRDDLEEPLHMFYHVFRTRAGAGAPYLKLKLPEEWHRLWGRDGKRGIPLVRLTFRSCGEK